MTDVRLRFAPSPTGYLHVGGARTALFNWLLARREGGKFILRIEDTDVARSTEESVAAIFEGMKWLGLDWDEGPYFQTERFPLYREYVAGLLASGKAYKCYCSTEELEAKRELAYKEGRKPKYDGTCRQREEIPGAPFVIRFKSPEEGVTAFDDLIKGRISFSNEELDDLIIQRSDGTPTYNFTVVIDDATMGITSVIRGDDHINNTPRQIQLYEALGCRVPQFAHVPMILGADKTRLSKRHGATSVMAYRDMGFLPEAMVNYLVRLGWSHGDDEIFSREELVRKFTIEAVGKSAGVFNPDKLLWLNHHYIKEKDPSELAGLLLPFLVQRGVDVERGPALPGVVKILQERCRTLVEMAESAVFFYRADFDYDPEAMAKFLRPDVIPLYEELLVRLKGMGDVHHDALEQLFKEFCASMGIKMGQIGPPVRIALCGGTTSPSIYEVIGLLGIQETESRIRRAIDHTRGEQAGGVA